MDDLENTPFFELLKGLPPLPKVPHHNPIEQKILLAMAKTILDNGHKIILYSPNQSEFAIVTSRKTTELNHVFGPDFDYSPWKHQVFFEHGPVFKLVVSRLGKKRSHSLKNGTATINFLRRFL